jgi:hypothetical protein
MRCTAWSMACAVSSLKRHSPRPSQSVKLVDEDDRRRLGAGLLEQVAHSRGADTDEHLDEFGAVDGKKRNGGLAGDRSREQRLTGARRTDQGHTLRHTRTKPSVLLRILSPAIAKPRFSESATLCEKRVVDGYILLSSLPTSDPGVTGAACRPPP